MQVHLLEGRERAVEQLLQQDREVVNRVALRGRRLRVFRERRLEEVETHQSELGRAEWQGKAEGKVPEQKLETRLA